MATIFHMTFPNAFSWMKMYEFRFKISLKFLPKDPIKSTPTLVQIMAWCQWWLIYWRIYASLGLNEWNRFCYKLFVKALTHWGRATYICISKLTIIGPDNGLSPGRCQAIIWTNIGILLIRPLGTNLSDILIGIQTFSFKKMHFKTSSAKWRPFCLGLNVLSKICPCLLQSINKNRLKPFVKALNRSSSHLSDLEKMNTNHLSQHKAALPVSHFYWSR